MSPTQSEERIELTNVDYLWGHLKGIRQSLAEALSHIHFDPQHEVFSPLSGEDVEALYLELMELVEDISGAMAGISPSKTTTQ